MKVLGFELKPRSYYDGEVASVSNVSPSELFAKILHDSLKRNWSGIKKWYYGRKYSPIKLMRILTREEIINAVREIRLLEKAKEEDLFYIDFELGNKTADEYVEWLKANKKKAEEIRSIMKQ